VNKVIKIISHSEQETLGLAKKIVGFFRPGDVIILSGPLGSGKTVFARGLAIALGIDENKVNSPSFTIVNEYQATVPLYHFDLYRLGDASELNEIGWYEYLNRDGLVVVEWGEKAEEYLPAQYYQIQFRRLNESEREILIEHKDNNNHG